MTYAQTLEYLFTRLPMFHRIGAAAYKADLNNTLALCALLEHPEKKFRSIHIAGTNGKGSSSHMLAAIFQKAGYKTGLYTSPHLKDFRERIRINGEKITEEKVVEFVNRYKNEFEKIDLSFFEWTVGLCFSYFAEENVDIAIVETGLGGRLDSTNVIVPEVSLITNISLDHTNLLGKTVEAIAGEKAGIIKPGVPVVIGEEEIETLPVFQQKADSVNSLLLIASRRGSAKIKREEVGRMLLDVEMNEIEYNDLALDLTGNYQLKNILGVLFVVDVMRERGWKIPTSVIYEALKDVKGLTGLTGRWQILQKKPLVICDVGHNEAGIKEVVKQISNTPHRQLHFVLGMVNDKDISSVLLLLPGNATYYFCKASIPRALDAEELKSLAAEKGLLGNSYPSVQDAYNASLYAAADDDLVIVGGSTFVVAEVL